MSAQPLTLTGACIKIYLNNKVYSVIQSITFTLDYGEVGVWGIDCVYAQEIAVTKITVTGSIKGIRVKQNGGLQAIAARPLFVDAVASPYISIRVQDRSTSEDIIFLPNAKISRETHAAVAKGVYSLSFDFTAQIPLMALDRSDPGFSAGSLF